MIEETRFNIAYVAMLLRSHNREDTCSFNKRNLVHFKARWSRRKHLNSSSHHCLGNRRILLQNQGVDSSKDHATLLGMK